MSLTTTISRAHLQSSICFDTQINLMVNGDVYLASQISLLLSLRIQLSCMRNNWINLFRLRDVFYGDSDNLIAEI